MRELADDERALVRSIVPTPRNVRGVLRSVPQSVFLRYRNDDSWSTRMGRRLRGSGEPQRWPRFEQLAGEFGLESSILRKRLETEGCGYQELRGQIRHELAREMLRGSACGLNEIAARLGFHDASSFHCSFKRWNGVRRGRSTRCADSTRSSSLQLPRLDGSADRQQAIGAFGDARLHTVFRARDGHADHVTADAYRNSHRDHVLDAFAASDKAARRASGSDVSLQALARG
ncbi:MAG: helix-turn-helix transcriptional regulator [Xanthomonadaceae bacterium]|nr:helix-turn-helix transcriptional regulator [Xanthomonadaceae bacterium]